MVRKEDIMKYIIGQAVPKKKKYYQFVCDKCRCVFVCERDDISLRYDYTGWSYYSIECPKCKLLQTYSSILFRRIRPSEEQLKIWSAKK